MDPKNLCISKFPDVADAAGPDATLWEPPALALEDVGLDPGFLTLLAMT